MIRLKTLGQNARRDAFPDVFPISGKPQLQIQARTAGPRGTLLIAGDSTLSHFLRLAMGLWAGPKSIPEAP